MHYLGGGRELYKLGNPLLGGSEGESIQVLAIL